MIDLITKENSFYAIYNEPFGDILKAFYVSSPNPALLALVADAPAPVDKDVTHIAKNVVQFAVQRIEISGVKNNPKQIVVDILNEIDRQLKVKKLTNGILCCSVIFIYDEFLYVGGVGDCTIALSNERGSLRFCHDGPNEPRPQGVENFTVAPAELMGLSADARLGDLPRPYGEESVYQFETDPSLNIYMFSDGLTKHIPDFFLDLAGQTSEDVFNRVNMDIPKDVDQLLDDICFTVIKMPPELAPKQVRHLPKRKSQADHSRDTANSGSTRGASKKTPVQASPQKSGGFWVLFMMLLIMMGMMALFGFWVFTEWMSFKSEIKEYLRSR